MNVDAGPSYYFLVYLCGQNATSDARPENNFSVFNDELRHRFVDELLAASSRNLDSSSDVTCAVNLCGAVADLTIFDNLSFLGGSPKDHMDLARSASPVNYVHAGEPAM